MVEEDFLNMMIGPHYLNNWIPKHHCEILWQIWIIAQVLKHFLDDLVLALCNLYDHYSLSKCCLV
jgi:hypothetical protein